ncbi:MAG: ABC transporter substrate-binding protein [Thermoleophilia bacterium]|nr:ABC transporter substrate-binding protein [Thermoleophilia bacterium]
MNRARLITIAGIVVFAMILVAFGPAPKQAGHDNVLRLAATSPPDSLDSAVSYQAASWNLQVNVYNGLLTYKKVAGHDGNTLVPDIAEAMPVLTDGGRTLTFHLRTGVMFGPPAKREVLPSDFKYTIERNAKIPSQGSFYYSVVNGFDKVSKSKKGSISGIDADDQARTLVFHLSRPDATFLNVLAMPFSFVVPKGLPLRDMSQSGFSSATGPYMFTEYDPSRRIVMKRNPSFKQWTKDSPDGHVDEIDMQLGVSQDNAITLFTQDKVDVPLTGIPTSKLPWLMNSKEWRPYLHLEETTRTPYIWMNNTTKPFDNVKVRQAVNWAINRRALVKLGGGAGVPSSTILPPSMPGYTGKNLYPKQDLAKAKQLVAESGVDMSKEITIWCTTAAPAPDMAAYLQAQLEAIGFSARTRCVDPSAFYQVTGAVATHAQIGFASWGADFPEGSNFIDVLFNGKYINPVQPNNMARYRGKDKEIDAANKLMNFDVRAKAWGQLDEEIQADAPWAPLSHGIARELVGKRVGDYVYHPVYEMLYMLATVDGSGTPNDKQHEHEAKMPGSDDNTGGDNS